MHHDNSKIQVCRIYSDQILVYDTFAQGVPRSDKQVENEKNLTRGDYNGFMSPKTRSKVKKYLSTWIESGMKLSRSHQSKHVDKVPHFTFVTLTLSSEQQHDDRVIKRKCLVPFIQQLQRKYNVWHYFWRAEAQKNGNIHFHLICDSFIDHSQLREDWNKCQNKLGYVDVFEARFNHHNPNSTDIHALRNVRNPAAYVIKYCTKSDGYRKIEGRIHGCSDGLRDLQPYEDLINGHVQDFVIDAVNDESSKVITTDDFTVIKCQTNKLMWKYSPRIAKEVAKYQISVAMQLYKIELPTAIQQITAKRERKKLVQLELFGAYGM